MVIIHSVSFPIPESYTVGGDNISETVQFSGISGWSILVGSNSYSNINLGFQPIYGGNNYSVTSMRGPSTTVSLAINATNMTSSAYILTTSISGYSTSVTTTVNGNSISNILVN